MFTPSLTFQVLLVSSLLFVSCSRKLPPAEVVQARPVVALHTVADSSETVESIALAYSMTLDEICRLNEISPSDTLVPGQKIAVIPPQGASSRPPEPKTSVVVSSAQPTEPTLLQEESSLDSPPETPITTTPSQNFVWPVQGKMLSRFRAKLPNGTVNEGVNISAPANTAVKAVADGTVVDSGELVLGFGKMIILSLDNGMIAIYGHLQEISLPKASDGQPVRVKRGQVIGRVGKTGNVRIPQLHFQLRDSAKQPVNPLKVLPPLD